jgi:peroxiredoxin
MVEGRQRRLIRYGIAAVIVLVIAGVFVQREILSDDTIEVAVGATDGDAAGDDPTTAEIGLLDDRSADIGDEAPDFLLTMLNADPVKLSDFRGKTVVLNFWASWCPPCRAEMPEFQALWEQRGTGGSDDLVILAVDFLKEDTVGAATDFVEDFELTFPILFDTTDGDVAARYGVRGLPATYFIDREGVIRARNLGPVFGGLLPDGVAAADAGGDSAAAR